MRVTSRIVAALMVMLLATGSRTAILRASDAGLQPITITVPVDPVADWMTTVEAQQMRSRFQDLEKLATMLRRDDPRLPGGHPKLNAFYTALGDFKDCTCTPVRVSLVPYGAKLRAIASWMAAVPHSPTATVAMARLLRQHAWTERGHDYADKTAADRLQAFHDTTARSLAYLRPLDPKTDPGIYVGLLSAARGSDDGRADMDRVFPAAIASFPTFFPLYENEADMLQERWFGKPGEAAAFLADLAGRGDEGLVAYADAVTRLDASNPTHDLQRLFGVDWPTLRHAFDVRRRLYGTSGRLQNQEMKLAVANADRQYAGRLLAVIDAEWSHDVWQRSSAFLAAAQWVRSGLGAPPTQE